MSLIKTICKNNKTIFTYHRVEIGLFDAIIYLITSLFIYVIYPSSIDQLPPILAIGHAVIGLIYIVIFRIIGKVYSQIWRYAGPKEYIRLITSDALAAIVFILTRRIVFDKTVTFVRAISLFTVNLLGCIITRHFYQWLYQKRMENKRFIVLSLRILKLLTGITFSNEQSSSNRIKIAIVGAGNVGAMLADELVLNQKSTYQPVCFVDIDKEKVGREINGIPVISGEDNLNEVLVSKGVQEVVFALPNVTNERKKELYSIYDSFGFKIKIYDYPTLDESGKRRIRDFDVDDLLFRNVSQFLTEETMMYYKGKSILITGGGGSIGSELARQIAKCKPSCLTIVDVYENGAYDIEQELRMRYGKDLNLQIEIINICNKELLVQSFREHSPDIVLHAAAHKHVPLMERNVIEAVENNVFGTLNVIEACEESKVKKCIMISTDKAVNPTSVMGATKRLCEMMVLSRCGEVCFTATRFGNVLGSNGSVIPLFKRQIQNGGPITVTDKRIIRYFMTIPEASQLVMTSGAMAEKGELYVLDMGKPVKIIELAENMIRLSGLVPYQDIDIIETGLRPGEKLYEELLIRGEELGKTSNNMIFVEKDKPLNQGDIDNMLDLLRAAVDSHSDVEVKKVLMQVIPTYRNAEEVNQEVIQ